MINDELLELYDETDIPINEIAKELGIRRKDAARIMNRIGDVRFSEIERREYEIKVLNVIGYDSVGDVPRCVQCEIFVLDKGKKVPDHWNPRVVQRFGDFCASCWGEMPAEYRKLLVDSCLNGCSICHDMNNLEPHAGMVYDAGGYVPIEAITMVCGECHGKIHANPLTVTENDIQ